MLEDISRLYILKQPNGKYALFNGERNEFVLINCENSSEIIDFVLERTGERIRCNILTKEKYFKCALEKYKQTRGLESEAVNEPADVEIQFLTSMGVPEETLEKKKPAIPGEVLTAELTGNGLTMGHKLKIMELAMGDPAVTTWHDDTLLEKKYRQIRDLVLEDCAGDTGESEPE